MSFAQKLEEIKNTKNISNYKLAKVFSISHSTVANWLNGKTAPSIEVVEKLAKYFDVDPSYFSENQDKKILPTPANETDVSNLVLADGNRELEILLNLYDQLSQDDQQLLVEQARLLSSRQKKSMEK